MKVTVNSPSPAPESPTGEPGPGDRSASQVIVSAPLQPSGPQIATWPEWFGVVDFAMAVLVVIAAFGVGSFAARNSDLWIHLATGRMIAEGTYTFGADPFSYTGEGRTWTNPSWLWQRVAYLLYQKDTSGTWLVAAKAIGFALSLVVVMLVRRPGAALWPWAVAAGFAVLAGGTFTQLRPFSINPLFVALTLFVLFRLEWKPGSWRNPILLAVTCCVWANLDGCFVFGPLTILLVLVGELLQSTVLKGGSDKPGAFGPPPPVSGLAKALILSLVLCMANPNHVHVWQLPPEFAAGLPAAGMMKDAELLLAVLEPYSEHFWEQPARGRNMNGAAYLVLFLLSGLSMALSFGKMRVAHLFVWLAFAYLSLHQWQFILPFSIVATAIAAAYLNLWSSGIELKTTDHPPTRFFLLGSGIGRSISVALAALMVPMAWPGYLHPSTGNPATMRRIAWAVEPDEGLADMATTIHGWREKGLLPADARGFYPNVDFANYLAWFAPKEKVFANSRFAFHKAEMPDLLAVRQELYFNPKQVKEGGVELTLVRKAMAENKAEFLAAVGQIVRPNPETTATLETTPGWSVWRVSGRGVVVGPDARTKLEYDPVAELLGPTATQLPDPLILAPPLGRESWADDFMTKTKPVPFGTDESFALREYAMLLNRKYLEEHTRQSFAFAAAVGGIAGIRGRGVSDGEITAPILSLRAARRALAENPDSPDAHYALSQLYANPLLPEIFVENPNLGRAGERQLQLVTALQRYLARMPKPEACNRRQATLAFLACEQLARTYIDTNQLDFCRDTCGLMKKYFLTGPGTEYQFQMNAAGQNPEQAKAMKAEFEGQKKRLDDIETHVEKRVADASDALRRANLTGTQKFFTTLQSGLPAAAYKSFEDVDPADYEKEYGRDSIAVALASVELLSRAGHLERAAAQLDRLVKWSEDLAKNLQADPNFAAGMKSQILEREYQIRTLEGNYRAAAEALERRNGNRFAPLPPALLAAARPQAVEASLAFGPLPALIVHQPLSMNVQQILVAESEFAYSRALLAVFDGRPLEAKSRFAQCLAPQGERLGPLPWSPYASRFLAMIERVNAPEKK